MTRVKNSRLDEFLECSSRLDDNLGIVRAGGNDVIDTETAMNNVQLLLKAIKEEFEEFVVDERLKELIAQL